MKGLFLTTILFISTQFLFAQNTTDAQGRKQGAWKKNYEGTTQVRYQGQFKDDKPVGKFTYFDRTGYLLAEVENLPNGSSYGKNYFPNGKVSSFGKFINQKKDSTWNFYDEEGKLLSIENYSNGEKNGVQKVYYKTGTVSVEQSYTNGKLNGKVISYFEDGKVQSENTFVDNVTDGISKTFYMNGNPKTEGMYVKSQRNGVWKDYNEDGSTHMITEYKGDVIVKETRMNGEFEELFENDLPKAWYNYKNGKLDGPFVEYQEGGSWELVEKEDPMTQEKNQYRVPVNHKVKRKGTYLSGKLNGKVDIYGPNGSVVKTETYLNGELK